jgi:hypothetical protein
MEAHDLVIASYSLNFEDIREAFAQDERLAKKRVVLYWFAGTANWELIRMDLFSKIHIASLRLFQNATSSSTYYMIWDFIGG